MKSRLATLVLAAALAAAGAAFAHPHVVGATPAVDGTVQGSPSRIQIQFTEAVVPKFSGIDLKDAAGHVVKTGPSAPSPSNAKVLVAPVQATLAPGAYTVEWHAVGDDTHHVTGTYAFTVK